MPKLGDRVREISTTAGTGTLTLDGPVERHQTFIGGVGATEQTFYWIIHRAEQEWEYGIGTVLSGPARLQRDTVLGGSAGAATLVNLSAGEKDVFVSVPSSRLPLLGSDGLVLPGMLPEPPGGQEFLGADAPWVVLGETTLAAQAASVAFTGLNTNYRYFRLVTQFEHDSANPRTIQIRLNGLAVSNSYGRTTTRWIRETAAATNIGTADSFTILAAPNDSRTYLEVVLAKPESTDEAIGVMKFFSVGPTANSRYEIGLWNWSNTAALINELEIAAVGAEFTVGSHFQLQGLETLP